MKMIDTCLFAVTLLLVPALAWTCGRVAGRRNWPISGVLVIGCIVTAIPYAARLTLQAATASQSFWDALRAQGVQSFYNPEVGMFLVTLSVFMTMLGWTATPVVPRSSAPSTEVASRAKRN